MTVSVPLTAEEAVALGRILMRFGSWEFTDSDDFKQHLSIFDKVMAALHGRGDTYRRLHELHAELIATNSERRHLLNTLERHLPPASEE